MGSPEGRSKSAQEISEGARERPFGVISSFGPGSFEVVSMKEQAKEGRPIAAYEFAQGMVDYGKDNKPPPRIFLVDQAGNRKEFTGNKAVPQNLRAIEFVNSGPGLAPEDTTIIYHGGGDRTLGQWGRGTSVSLTHLAAEGMQTEIESNFPDGDIKGGRAWKGTTSLSETETGKTAVLTVRGSWLGIRTNQTVFRVLNPTENFVSQVLSLPNYFLPANPRYPEAVVVNNKEAVQPVVSLAIASHDKKKVGRVQCLRGLVDIEGSGDIFVDGLRVANHYDMGFHFPWAVEGFKDHGYPFNVKRSHDSRRVGEGDPSALVQMALRHNKDPEIFEELLMVATDEKTPSYRLPLEVKPSFSHEKQPLSLESKRLLKTVWRKKFGDSVIVRDKKEKEDFGKHHSDKAAIVVQGVMFDWLQEAEIKTASETLGILKTEEIETGKEINVDYADDPDCLTKLFLEAGESCLSIPEIFKEGDRKVVKIRFPYSVAKEDDFYDRRKPGAQWIRVAAVIVQKLGISLQVVSRSSELEIRHEIEAKPASKNNFRTNVKTTHRAGEKLTEEFPSGLTEVIIRGDLLQSLEPPPSLADSLRKIAEQRKTAITGRRESARERILGEGDEEGDKKSSDVSRRSFLKVALKGAAVLGVGGVLWKILKDLPPPSGGIDWGRLFERMVSDPNFELDTLKNEAIGNYAEPLGVHELNYAAPPEIGGAKGRSEFRSGVRFELGDLSFEMDGYWREFIGTRFVRNQISGRGQWIDLEKYEGVNIPRSAPAKFMAKIRLRGFRGQQRLPVKTGTVLVGINDQTIELFREARSKNYVIRGFAENKEVEVYVGKDSDPLNKNGPISAESASMLKVESLRQDWQEIIGRMKTSKLSNGEKVAIILSKWGRGYVYSDNPQLDRQVSGKTVEDITVQIINEQAGLCNTAATGFVALLREAGVPARVVTGRSVSQGDAGPHMWAEFWNGTNWEEIEPLYGSQLHPETLRRRQNYLRSVQNSRQAKDTEQRLRKEKKKVEEFKPEIEDGLGLKGRDIGFILAGIAVGVGGKMILDRISSNRETV